MSFFSQEENAKGDSAAKYFRIHKKTYTPGEDLFLVTNIASDISSVQLPELDWTDITRNIDTTVVQRDGSYTACVGLSLPPTAALY